MQLARKMHIPYVHSPISVGAVIIKEKTKDIESHRIDTEQTVFENAAIICSITESEKENIISYYGIAKEKIIVIGRPVAKEYLYPIHDGWGNVRNEKMQYFPTPSLTKNHHMNSVENWWERKAFTYVGRIHHNKGIHHIIHAWIMLKKQYVDTCPPLWIVGGTPVEINEFHLEHNLHLELYEEDGSIIWWGRLNAEGISSLYMRSLALVMHSKYEPGGRVSIEAMSAALPVIATPCGFAIDTITDWQNGFLVEYGDEKKLAERMSIFILQPYLSDSMGYNARESAINISKKWNFTEHHINIYNQLISSEFIVDNEENDLAKNQWIWGLVRSYPANLPEISEQYILRKFSDMTESDISVTIKKDCDSVGYFKWNIQGKEASFYVYQPYNRVNIIRLLDTNRYSKIVFASSIYANLKKWIYSFPSPVLSFIDEKQAIIMRPNSLIEYNVETFSGVINFITYYKHNISNQIQIDIKKIISQKNGIYETINRYKTYVDGLEMCSQYDFSIALEAEWILNKVKGCIMLQGILRPSHIEYFFKLTAQSYIKHIVLGGLIQSKGLCNCEDKLCLLTTEALHPVEDGYDEGTLLLFTSGDNTDIAVWYSLIRKIPIETQQNAVWWAIIFLAKRILINRIMSIYPEKAETLYTQLDILMDFN